MNPSRRTLAQNIALAWYIPGAVAVLLSVCAVLMLGWVEYRHSESKVMQQLMERSNTAARRLAAEYLLGERGAPAQVGEMLRADLGLAGLESGDIGQACVKRDSASDVCVQRSARSLSIMRPIPVIQRALYVRVTASVPTYSESLRPSLLLWSLLPILLILGLSAVALNRFLLRHVILPVQELMQDAHRNPALPEHWSIEFVALSQQLKETFRKRDFAMVGQLASGVIHDMRTLLHSTWSAASLASEQAPGTEKRAQRLESLLKATETNFPKMQNLIESTLDGAREIQVEVTAKSVGSTIDQAVRVNEALARHAGVSVEVQIASSVPAIAQDSAQLERALINLIKNAIEAASAGKLAKIVRITVNQSAEGNVRISVEDSGAGLGLEPASVLVSIRSTKLHGTGLGLVVSRKIIEAHRGRLIAGRSTDLKGARFEVILPAAGDCL